MPDVNQMIMQSLLTTTLPILLVTVVVIVVVWVLVRRMLGGSPADKALMASGETAQATIVRMWDTGVKINDNPRVGLLLDVRPTNRAPFQAEVKRVISILEVPQFQPGQMVEVKYNPADTSKVVISAIVTGGGMGMGAQGMNQAGAAQLQASLQQQDALNQQIIATGEPAPAKVLTMQPLGIMVNGNNPYASISLQVLPNGRPPFVAQTQAVIAAQSVARYQPGATIAVRFDPKDMTKVAIEHS